MIIFYISTFVLLCLLIVDLIQNVIFYTKSKVIVGTVIEKITIDNGDGSITVPLIEYQDQDKTFTFRSNYATRSEVGDHVEIRFLRYKNKRKCELNSKLKIFFFDIIFLPLIFLLSFIVITELFK